jgi:hypothetical protein
MAGIGNLANCDILSNNGASTVLRRDGVEAIDQMQRCKVNR